MGKMSKKIAKLTDVLLPHNKQLLSDVYYNWLSSDS